MAPASPTSSSSPRRAAAASPAASSDGKEPVTRVRSKEFQVAWEVKYGVQVAAREAASGEVVSVKCLFCEHFGRDTVDEESRKRKRTANVLHFKKPWRGDNIASHMIKQHAVRYAEYKALSAADKARFFGARSSDSTSALTVVKTDNDVTQTQVQQTLAQQPGAGSVAANGVAAATAVLPGLASAISSSSESVSVRAVDAAVGMSRLVESSDRSTRLKTSTESTATATATAPVNSHAPPAQLAPAMRVSTSSSSCLRSLQCLVDKPVVTFVCDELLPSLATTAATPTTPTATSSEAPSTVFTLQPEEEDDDSDDDIADRDTARYLVHVGDVQSFDALAKFLVAGFALPQCAELLSAPPSTTESSLASARVLANAQALCALNYRAIAMALRSVWAFTLVFDAGVTPDPHFVDVRVRFADATTALHDVHVLALPLDSDSSDAMLERITHALAAVCPNWQAKVVGIAIDGMAKTPEPLARVIEALQTQHVAFGSYSVWCGARELGAIVQRAVAHVCDDAFVATLARLTGYVTRREQRSSSSSSSAPSKLIGATPCPRFTSAHWTALAPVLSWCVVNHAVVQQHVDRHNSSSDGDSTYAPDNAWWVALYALHAVTALAQRCLASLGTLAAYGAEQNRAIEQLLIALVANAYVDGPGRFADDASAGVVRGDYRVLYESAAMFVTKQSADAADVLVALEDAEPQASATVVRNVATMLADGANALAKLRTERARMTGLSDILPAVRPQDLAATTSAFDLSRVLSLQRDRLLVSFGPDDVKAISTEFAAFLKASESDAALSALLKALPVRASVSASWQSLYTRFPMLYRFVSGLATVYRDASAPDMAVLAADDATAQVDRMTVEAVLHAQQYDALCVLATQQQQQA